MSRFHPATRRLSAEEARRLVPLITAELVIESPPRTYKGECVWKKIWNFLRREIFNKECILGALIVEIIFWTPVWVPVLINFITGNPWWLTISGAVCLFWAGPFTPAIPLQLALIAAINKLIKKIKERRKN